MNQITRYMLKQVIGLTVFVTVALCFAIWLTQSLRLIDLIVNRGLPLSLFLYMATLLLPRFLTIVLPIAVFCATLFIYNRLSTDSELVVLRAAGLNPMSIARGGLIAGVLGSLVMAALNFYLLPASYREFKDLQHAIRSDYSNILTQEGVFNSIGDGITVFIRERGGAGELRGILVHDSRNPDQPVTMMAERGALVRTDDGLRVILLNGNRQHVDRRKGELSLLYFDRYVVEISGSKAPSYVRYRDPRERFLLDLLSPGNSPDDKRNYNKLIAEGHNRLTTTLLPLTYSAAGIAILLTLQFSRRSQTPVIIAAALFMALIAVGQIGFFNLAARTPIAVFAMYAITIIPLLAALYVLANPMRRRAVPATNPAA
jgi:lipopolysaccharide export system permease protein